MHRIIKCLGALSAVTVLAISLCACGGSKITFVDDEEPPVYLSFFSSENFAELDVTKYWADRFTERYNKKVYVNFDSAKYYDDNKLPYRELLESRLESSAPDDMYIISAEDVLEFGKKGYWMDLSDMDFVDNLSDAARYQSSCYGKVFSVPLSFTGFGFAWNVDMLERHGLTVPQNLTEFFNVCGKLKSEGILPYGANKGYALTVPAMCVGLSSLYNAPDSESQIEKLNSGDKMISEYVRSGYEFLLEMIKRGYLDAEQAMKATPRGDDFDMFKQEKCAFVCTGLNNVRTLNPSFKWEVTGLPVLPDGFASVYGADDRLCINPKSKHLDIVREFVEMVGTSESLAINAKMEGVMSSAKDGDNRDFPSENQLVGQLRKSGQIPNQDFALHFNTWESIRDAGRELCNGASVESVCEMLDKKQLDDLAAYSYDNLTDQI